MPHLTWSDTLRLRMSLVAVIALPAMLFAPFATAEIYRCVAKNGLPLYQNFPCHLDSVDLLPSTVHIANAAARNAPDKKIAAAARPNGKSSSPREPSVGMTSAEITTIMGEPVERIQDEPEMGGPISIWRYANGTSVQFDRRHRVLEIQR